jgi:hypothetical protein
MTEILLKVEVSDFIGAVKRFATSCEKGRNKTKHSIKVNALFS